ncbi:hypothetical protein ACLKA7_006883 [Drosophila subpalustris]
MESYKNFLIISILGAAKTISEIRLHSVLDNLKPHGAPIIIGGLTAGFLIYCGHRWLATAAEVEVTTTTTVTTPITDAAVGNEKPKNREQ